MVPTFKLETLAFLIYYLKLAHFCFGLVCLILLERNPQTSKFPLCCTKILAACTLAGVSDLLVSLDPTGRGRVVLGHMLNTVRHIITKNISSCFMMLGRIHSHPGLHAACGPQVGRLC